MLIFGLVVLGGSERRQLFRVGWGLQENPWWSTGAAAGQNQMLAEESFLKHVQCLHHRRCGVS